MKRVCFELAAISESLRHCYPLLKGIRAWNVSETRWCGLVGCDLYRITWGNGAVEIHGITAPTLAECIEFIESELAELARATGHSFPLSGLVQDGSCTGPDIYDLDLGGES